MSSWNEFCDDARRFANKAAKKTGELAHSATLRVKLEATKAKLSGRFETLGRLTYKQLISGETQAEKISEVISDIEKLREEEKELKKQISEAKKKEEAEE